MAPGLRAAQLAALEGVLEIAPGVGLALSAGPGDVPAAGTPVAMSGARRRRKMRGRAC